MLRFVLANTATAAHRRVYFHLVDATDGITPENGEAAGQPQISSDGAAWTNTGIGTLTLIGNGRYYADLTQAVVSTAGTIISSRYKSAATAECPGDTCHVVAFDPHSVSMGLSLAKTTNLTGFNDLSAAQVNAEADTALLDVGVTTTVTGRIDAAITSRLAPTVAARTLDVSTTGEAGIDWANIGAPTTAQTLSGTTVGTATATTTVNGLAAGVITAASIAVAALNGKGDWNVGKTGYALSAAGVQAIWDAVTSALTTVGSIGKRLVDFITGDIFARLGAPAGASIAADIAAIFAAVDTEVAAILAAVDTEVAAIKVKTDNLPAAPAAVSDIPTALAMWNLADGVETGMTPKQAMRALVAFAAGLTNGAGSATIIFQNPAGAATRITMTVDPLTGERTAVVLNL